MLRPQAPRVEAVWRGFLEELPGLQLRRLWKSRNQVLPAEGGGKGQIWGLVPVEFVGLG